MLYYFYYNITVTLFQIVHLYNFMKFITNLQIQYFNKYKVYKYNEYIFVN